MVPQGVGTLLGRACVNSCNDMSPSLKHFQAKFLFCIMICLHGLCTYSGVQLKSSVCPKPKLGVKKIQFRVTIFVHICLFLQNQPAKIGLHVLRREVDFLSRIETSCPHVCFSGQVLWCYVLGR